MSAGDITDSVLPMADYGSAKNEFLDWLKNQAENYDTRIDIDYSSKVYYREPDVLARLRATTKRDRFQTRNTIDELEVDENLSEKFDTILSVVLQLNEQYTYNPNTDYFYPFRVRTIEEFTGERHESGEYQLNFPFDERIAKLRRNDIEFALQIPGETSEIIHTSQTSTDESADFKEELNNFREDVDNALHDGENNN